ncbi:hypothetical protein [Actinoplanes friuliensis]|uniref:Uncharacterized protein n=1 Tax=Actinoplanes friuliensis DSM 7358 TaxID=1246995 RepID=U5W0U6_9ACTN|nr:hypothetical protein [Actinoplanes friuliensis]AGZ41565.1 hypothetical protein AFR_16415 [Actinoplanes friuliensis DSM 7358]
MSFDEKSPTELLEPMNVDPDQPSRVDIAAAMRTGRRRKRFTITGAGAAIAALVGGVAIGGNLAFGGADPAPLPPLPDCVGIPLPMAGYETVEVTGADPTGRWIAGQANPIAGTVSAAVVWHDDKVVEVLKKPGIALHDLTSTGVGVASGYGKGSYLYRNGELTPLEGGKWLSARSINENGVIAGESGKRSVRWASATAEPEVLPLPAGATGSMIVDLAEDGTILGQVADAHHDLTGYLWFPDGTGRAIPVPRDGDREATRYRAEQIRGGWVYGRAEVPAVVSVAPSDGSTTGTLYDVSKEAPFRYEIATGKSERLAYPSNLSEPFLHLGNRLVVLPVDRARPAGYRAITVGADGLTAAGHGNPGTSAPFYPMSWRCK